MDRIRLQAFSLDRDALLHYTDEIKSICDQKSVEYKGPGTPPVYNFQGPLTDLSIEDWLEGAPEWVKSLEIDDQDFSRLRLFEQATEASKLALFGRQYEVYDSDVTRQVVELPLPETVCLHVDIDTIENDIGGDHSPYTYDPGRDHVTDIDFEANR